MRVSELANELGKTSKEILEIIKQKDKAAVLYAASNVSKEQENIVRSSLSPKKEAVKAPAPKPEAPKAEAPRQEASKAEAPRTGEGAPKAEPAKKKLTAVFRPQNAKQQIKRPVPPKPQQPVRAQETAPVQAQPQENRQAREERAACLLYTS